MTEDDNDEHKSGKRGKVLAALKEVDSVVVEDSGDGAIVVEDD